MTKTHRMPGIIGVMAPVWYGLPDPPTTGPLPMVLLRHESPSRPPHLDWMIARGSGACQLASWRLSAWPEAGYRIDRVTAVADHDRAWLIREGPLSGGRGTAYRVDSGVLVGWTKCGDTALLDLLWTGAGAQSLELSASASGVWSLARAAR